MNSLPWREREGAMSDDSTTLDELVDVVQELMLDQNLLLLVFALVAG